MLNIGICDDKLVFASKTETMLFDIGKKMMIAMNIEVYSDGCELWRDFQAGTLFGILYLDIEMIKINGIDLAIHDSSFPIHNILYIRYVEFIWR